MKTFSVLSMLIALATAAALMAKGRPHEASPTETPKAIRAVSYESISVDGVAKCRFRQDDDLGVEFRASAFGVAQARMAYDGEKYWFWIRAHDPRRYYFCRQSEVPASGVMPPLRPSFARWLLNRERDGSTSFADGEYTVHITAVDGAVTRQTYMRDGHVEADLTVLAFQTKGSRRFPAVALLELPLESISLEIDLGDVDVNPASAPDTREPAGLAGRRLAL